MCHAHDNRRPEPLRSCDVAERGILTLGSADGTPFSAAQAAHRANSDWAGAGRHASDHVLALTDRVARP